MTILDENLPESQRQLLRSWRIRIKQIGQDIGRQGMKDANEIIPFLIELGRVTFLTRDLGFFRGQLRHRRYGLVCLAVGINEAASFIRRILQHPAFDTRAKRMGTVVLVQEIGLRAWLQGASEETRIAW